MPVDFFRGDNVKILRDLHFSQNQPLKSADDQYTTIEYTTVQYTTVQYTTVQHTTIQKHVIRTYECVNIFISQLVLIFPAT
jgi:hypothetical protein